MMDLLPTITVITEAKPPQKPIDGHDIRPLLFGESDARSPYDRTVQCLRNYAETARQTLGDNETRGTAQRDAGHVENPTPRVKP